MGYFIRAAKVQVVGTENRITILDFSHWNSSGTYYKINEREKERQH
jgi:hypothetical protein